MPQTLSERTIALVRAIVSALEAHGLDIAREMYARMFRNPEIRDPFNQSHHGDAGSQPRALATETQIGEADYHLCDPRPFLRTFISALSLAGAPSDSIHYEFFGPADELLDA